VISRLACGDALCGRYDRSQTALGKSRSDRLEDGQSGNQLRVGRVADAQRTRSRLAATDSAAMSVTWTVVKERSRTLDWSAKTKPRADSCPRDFNGAKKCSRRLPCTHTVPRRISMDANSRVQAHDSFRVRTPCTVSTLHRHAIRIMLVNCGSSGYNDPVFVSLNNSESCRCA
jgi:hypothetical protein